jgi:isopenicillin-N epimerase
MQDPEAARAAFTLDPAWLTLNHGSFGAAPRAVLAAQHAWRAQLEAQPTRFMTLELPGALRAAAARLARFLGADAPGLGFIENATAACNAVLRSLTFAPGDEVLVLSHGYAAVRNAAAHIAGAAGAHVVAVPIPFPRPDAAALTAALSAALTARTRLVILDHITSPSALVLPLPALIAACRARAVPVLVDGAHAPGQLPLDLTALGADWYTGNCHKWLLAPKGCAFLWTAPAWRALTHAHVISHGLGQGVAAELDWAGTRDPSAFLAIDAAIEAHAELGGAALMARNRALARWAGDLLAARLGTEVAAQPDQAGSMAAIRLPGPGTAERALALRHSLLAARIDVPVHAIDGALWLRVSAAAYNAPAEYEALADRLPALLSR